LIIYRNDERIKFSFKLNSVKTTKDVHFPGMKLSKDCAVKSRNCLTRINDKNENHLYKSQQSKTEPAFPYRS